MSPLFLTIGIAFIIILLALFALAIGLFLTGKSKLKRGSCGRLPNQKKDDDCGSSSSCELCEKNDLSKRP